jgi:hypothetical protein
VRPLPPIPCGWRPSGSDGGSSGFSFRGYQPLRHPRQASDNSAQRHLTRLVPPGWVEVRVICQGKRNKSMREFVDRMRITALGLISWPLGEQTNRLKHSSHDVQKWLRFDNTLRGIDHPALPRGLHPTLFSLCPSLSSCGSLPHLLSGRLG